MIAAVIARLLIACGATAGLALLGVGLSLLFDGMSAVVGIAVVMTATCAWLLQMAVRVGAELTAAREIVERTARRNLRLQRRLSEAGIDPLRD